MSQLIPPKNGAFGTVSLVDDPFNSGISTKSSWEVIGRGSFGKVYLLKEYKPPIVMKKGYSQNLIDQSSEMGILKELVHENIVRFIDQPLDFEYAGGSFLIFQEYCCEGSLRNVICDPTVNYSMATLTKWAHNIFSALRFLKTKRIAHRDVKLENIFVTEGFELKLGDFGIFKRFEDGKEVAIDNAGTPNYMAPELLENSSQLSEDDLYQCDVFAAGLVLWEATFRERLPNSSSGNSPITLHFPSTTSPDVQQCFDLIERCSSSKISIKSRLTTEQALLEVESLGENFKSLIFEPERSRNQCLKTLPEGLCIELSTTHNSLHPPDATFGTESQKTKPTESRKIDSTFENQFNQWISRTQRESNFKNMIGKTHNEKPCSQSCTCRKSMSIFNYLDNFLIFPKHAEVLLDKTRVANVNATREELRKNFLNSVEQICASEKPTLLIHLKEMHNNLSGSDDFSRYNESLQSTIKHFVELFKFDIALQEFCYKFALKTLWKCQAKGFSWMELLDLLNVAIHNIEECDHIYIRRRQYDKVVFTDSRAEWCHSYQLAFTKDLREIRKVNPFYDYIFNSPSVIDLEVIRRALHRKKNEISKFQPYDCKRGKLYKDLKSRHETLTIFGTGSLPKTELEVLLQALSIGSESHFPGYTFFFNWLPLQNKETSCHCSVLCEKRKFSETGLLHDINLCYVMCKERNEKLKDLRLEENTQFDLESLYELEQRACGDECVFTLNVPNSDRKESDTQCLTRFPGLIWESNPKYAIRPVCDCKPIHCSVGKFPENAPNSEVQFEYSTCLKLNQKEFLETHSLFEKAFRLLNEWEDLENMKETHLYLIESLLEEMKDKEDPSYGFCFMLVKQCDLQEVRNRNFFVCDHMTADSRFGFLINLGGQSLLISKDFHLQDCCMFCMNQFVELIYVSLYELADLLSIMQQYLTPGWLYTEEMNTTKFHSVPKIVPLRLPTEELNTTSSHMTSEDYHVEMESAFQRFWSNNTIGSLPKTYKF